MISLRDVVTGFGNRDPLAEVWRRDLRGGGSAEITGALPLYYNAKGTPLTDYLIYGNTLQDGTPTPESPVDVVGCGTNTANGYKLPLTVNGTEHPIYLGTVPTTRRIKKLVLTGEETTWRITGSGRMAVRAITGSTIPSGASCVCSHFVGTNSTSFADISDGECAAQMTGAGGYREIGFYSISYTTLDAFKQYIAAQYANGTPVTVWYVLAKSETGIVNEPLMKIGDYADTLSMDQAGVTIPTVSGDNVLDTTSTVKPSEVYIKGRGIKLTG